MLSANFLNKGWAFVIAFVICGSGCAAHKQLTPAGESVRGERLRIAVLPVENLSGKKAPLQEIRQSLEQGIVKLGAVVHPDAYLERFMARHRIRYTGGIDSFTSRLFMDEMGVDAVLITSLEQYADTPRIDLTARLVSTGGTPHILWIENVGLAGDDSFGVLGLGLIGDLPRLQEKAIERTTASLARFLSNKMLMENGGSGGLYQPKIAYQTRFLVPGGKYTVAVLPFFNRSGQRRADDIMGLHIISQLEKIKAFEVVEPGLLREKLLNFRIIMDEGPSLAELDLLFNSLQTDFIFMGKILEYDLGGTPKMEFEVQVYQRTNRKVVWSSLSYNRGDDGVFFFDWRKVNNAGVLASKMVKAIVQSITAELRRYPETDISPQRHEGDQKQGEQKKEFQNILLRTAVFP
jgi:TolB-like protein